MKIRLGDISGFSQPNPDIGPRAFAREHAATITALGECGIDLSQSSVGKDSRKLIEAIGSTFLHEVAPVQYMRGVTAEERRFIGNDLQPRFKKLLRQEDGGALTVAHQLGRLMGSDGRNIVKVNHPVNVQKDKVVTDGVAVPFEIKTGLVIEFGMGLAGLYSHIQNVKSGLYRVTGVHASKPETQLLKGIAEVNKVNGPNAISITDEGITKSINDLLSDPEATTADIVIASRVHPAGVHLASNLSKISKILRPGGLFVGRGPRRYKQGINYDQVARGVLQDPSMAQVINKTYNLPGAPRGAQEPNRLVIASKAG
jgi:hypothetical protein